MKTTDTTKQAKAAQKRTATQIKKTVERAEEKKIHEYTRYARQALASHTYEYTRAVKEELKVQADRLLLTRLIVHLEIYEQKPTKQEIEEMAKRVFSEVMPSTLWEWEERLYNNLTRDERPSAARHAKEMGLTPNGPGWLGCRNVYGPVPTERDNKT